MNTKDSKKDSTMMTEEEFLAKYDLSKYPPKAVTVDLLIFTIEEGELKILLIKRGGHPEMGKWALPGGFVNNNESIDKAALRELQEETNLDARGWLEQLKTYGDPHRDPRGYVTSVAYVGFIPNLGEFKAGDDAAHAELIVVDDILNGDLQMAFDHKKIVADGLNRVRAKIEYQTITPDFIPKDEFTLAELRHVYEVVWGKKIPAPNFRRKVLATPGFLIPVGKKGASEIEGGRLSELYTKGDASRIYPEMRRPED